MLLIVFAIDVWLGSKYVSEYTIKLDKWIFFSFCSGESYAVFVAKSSQRLTQCHMDIF